MHPHHPMLLLDPAELRPTQLTVGYAEVAAKRAQWERLGQQKRKILLSRHWFPGVLVPKQHCYIVDHHHLGLALLEEGVASVPVMVLRNFPGCRRRSSGARWSSASGPIPATSTTGGVSTPPFRAAWRSCRTIPTAALPRACRTPAATPRMRFRMPSSCGPASCASG